MQTVVHSMACDGEVHDDEITAIREMSSEAAYFADLDSQPIVDEVLNKISSRGQRAIEEHFEVLKNLPISSQQEILYYEVLLRMIKADGHVHASERRFVQRIKKVLGTEDRTLIVNFPSHVDILLRSQDENTTTFRPLDSIPSLDLGDGIDDPTNDGAS